MEKFKGSLRDFYNWLTSAQPVIKLHLITFSPCFQITNMIVGATVSDFGLPWDLRAEIDFLV